MLELWGDFFGQYDGDADQVEIPVVPDMALMPRYFVPTFRRE